MSERIGNVIIITPEPDQQCDNCGKIAELRPYGPNGSCICFACGQLDSEGTDRRMGIVLFGDEVRDAE
jgi:hypothetical protein